MPDNLPGAFLLLSFLCKLCSAAFRRDTVENKNPILLSLPVLLVLETIVGIKTNQIFALSAVSVLRSHSLFFHSFLMFL